MLLNKTTITLGLVCLSCLMSGCSTYSDRLSSYEQRQLDYPDDSARKQTGNSYKPPASAFKEIREHGLIIRPMQITRFNKDTFTKAQKKNRLLNFLECATHEQNFNIFCAYYGVDLLFV